MKKLLLFLGLLTCTSLQAEPLKQVFNTFTNKPDYITRIDTNTIIPGSGVTVTCTNGACTVNSSGGSGVTVYPASATASFPFGFSASTGVFSTSVQSSQLLADASSGALDLYASGVNACRFTVFGIRCTSNGSTGNPGSALQGDAGSSQTTGIIGNATASGSLIGVQGNSSRTGGAGVEGSFSPTGNLTGVGVHGVTAVAGASATEYAGKFDGVGNDGAGIYGIWGSATGGTGGANNYGLFIAAGQGQINSSMTITGAGGLGVTYNVNAGTITGAGLSACGDGTHALSWTGGLFGCQAISTSGGASSTLAVGTGTLSGWSGVITSSPTSVVLLDQSQFSTTLQGGATAFITIQAGVSSVSGNFTIGSTSTVVLANCSSACTVTLPTAVGVTGRVFSVKRTSTAAVTIATTSSQTIDGAITQVLVQQYTSIDMISDGSNWSIE